MAKNYYNILGVDKNASEDDIKKAYKKAAIKYHPDKLSGKSEEEKKAGEEKFKEINEAYQVLSDKDKRQKYDMFGDPDMQGGFSGGFTNGFNFDMGDAFRDFFSGGRSSRNQRSNVVEPGATIQQHISINIDEYLNGAKKTFKYHIKTRCKKCNGEGGTGKSTCDKCYGTGRYRQIKQTMFGTSAIETDCPYCHGQGSKVDKVCNECNGEGLKTEERTITIDIPKFCPEGHKIVSYGNGYESKNPKGKNGDLIFIVTYNFGDNFKVQGTDIYQLVDVDWYDAILGCDKEISIGNTKKLNITIPECSKDEDIIYIPKANINGFRYNIVLNYQMPNHLNSKEREILEKIRK